jgi:hypothetical protein
MNSDQMQPGKKDSSMEKKSTLGATNPNSHRRAIALPGVIAVALMICAGLGICGVMGVIGALSTSAFRATASPTLPVVQNTPIETPIVQRISPSLTPLPGQIGVRPSQTAYALTRAAYPTEIAFQTSAVPTRPIVMNEGTATKFIKTLEPLLTQVRTHPSGTTGLCNDGKYTSVQPKEEACHYDGGIFAWWGPIGK